MITFNDFLNSLEEKETPQREMIVTALRFLLNEGYITQSEFENRHSDRLNRIRTYPIGDGVLYVSLDFDDNEWTISIKVNKQLEVLKATLYSNNEDSEILYISKVDNGKIQHYQIG